MLTTEDNATRDKPTILFVAEAVTLAHFARIATLAKELDQGAYDIVVASDPRYLDLGKPFDLKFHPLQSIPSAEFALALARGKPIYDTKTLNYYIEDDLALLDAIKPDMVVGDFRLSLSVSAPLRKVPYTAIVNAYWSPYADTTYPVPDLPVTRLLGVDMGQKLFDLVRPLAFALHARPLNQARQRYGLPPLGHDMRKAYTWGDYTLYADIPEVVPTRNLPAHHRYLGPVLWSTATILPDWWSNLPNDKPLVFLTLGSSGRADLVPMVLRALAQLPVTVVAATAGRVDLGELPSNVYATDYLPLNLAAQKSSLVVSNGGSMTTYQSLADGVPVMGICTNMDQLLNMGAVARLGAGVSLRAGKTDLQEVQTAATELLGSSSYKQAAERVSQAIKRYDAGKCFRAFISEVLGR